MLFTAHASHYLVPDLGVWRDYIGLLEAADGLAADVVLL